MTSCDPAASRRCSAQPGLVEALRPTSVPAAGAIAAAEEAGAEIAPLVWCFANPAGSVTAEAFERVAALMVAALSDAMEAGPLDGVFLELHGAMVAEGFDDAEGELLRRVRAAVGPDMPVAASLDPHANTTAAMVAHADVLVPYRTYPHVDMRAAGARAMRLLLERARRGRPWAKSFRQVDSSYPSARNAPWCRRCATCWRSAPASPGRRASPSSPFASASLTPTSRTAAFRFRLRR